MFQCHWKLHLQFSGSISFVKHPRKKRLAYCPKIAPFFPISSKKTLSAPSRHFLYIVIFLFYEYWLSFLKAKGLLFLCAVQTLKAENPHILWTDSFVSWINWRAESSFSQHDASPQSSFQLPANCSFPKPSTMTGFILNRKLWSSASKLEFLHWFHEKS